MKRLLSFYGDDFTGSTDAMEALASQGVRTVLFTRIPTPGEFAPFASYEAIGLAGTSRSQTPEWMDEHLPPAFEWLKALNARFCHYKVCSTFDSSPTIGSIGRATEIGLRIFQQPRAILLLGAPQLKRYTFAGHLFAMYQGKIYRIDRHPVMSVHPVTPMHESDVLKHLSLQTPASVGLIDVHDGATQEAAGQALLETSGFIVGSSGVEYALLAVLQKPRIVFPPLQPVKQMLVISGSVSPTTARQIAFAAENGFLPFAVDPIVLANGREGAVVKQVSAVLASGKSPLIYSASGPASDQSEKLSGIPGARQSLSRALGRIAHELVVRFGLKRLVIAGGDTSSHALGQLDIHALTTHLPLPETPGSPLCVAYSSNAAFNGLELALKGGQIGGDDYFVRVRG